MGALVAVALWCAPALAQYFPGGVSTLTPPEVGASAMYTLEVWDSPALGLTDEITVTIPDVTTSFGYPMGAPIGEIVVSTDMTGDGIFYTMAVTAQTADTLDFDVICTYAVPALVSEIVLSGGVDPAGTVAASGSVLLGPAGVTITFTGLSPLPAGAPVTPALADWNWFIQFYDMPLDLPLAPTVLDVVTDYVSVAGDTATYTESIPISYASYGTSLSWALATTAAGAATSLDLTITDEPGTDITVQAELTVDGGSFDLGGYVADDLVGSGSLGVFGPDDFTFEMSVLDALPDSISAAITVTAVEPSLLTLLLSLGMPDPTGTSIGMMTLENIAGGVSIQLAASIFGPGTPIVLLDPAAQDYSIDVPFLVPATPGEDLTMSGWLTSNTGAQTFVIQAIPITGAASGTFDRGDCNTDGGFDIGDGIYLLASLFSGGAVPSCADACDANDDGLNDIGDAIYMLSALFSGGAPPAAPHGVCGGDPTADGLDCAAFGICP